MSRSIPMIYGVGLSIREESSDGNDVIRTCSYVNGWINCNNAMMNKLVSFLLSPITIILLSLSIAA